MLLDRVTNTGTAPRAGHPQVITVAELLGRESATTVRDLEPVAERRRDGSWVNKATVATAVVTFGSVLALGSTFLPQSHVADDTDTGSPANVPITEALSAKPPSAAPVAKPSPPKPATPNPAAGPVVPGSAATGPASGAPGVPAPAGLSGPAVQSRPLNQPQTTPPGPARYAAPTPRAPQSTTAQGSTAQSGTAQSGTAQSGATGGSGKSWKSGKGKSGKSGAHRATAQRPATAKKAGGSSAHAAAAKGGLGGVVGGIAGGLL